jgi:putative ABC transport system substrate-binding protein
VDRRSALAALAVIPLLAHPAFATPGRRKRVGWVAGAASQRELAANPRAFTTSRAAVDGLRSLGWIVGHNLEFVWRSAEGDYQRLGAIYDELVAMPVDVLVVQQRADLAVARTQRIPIVINGTGSSSHLKSESSKNFPANVTGMLWAHTETSGKTLSLLAAVVPQARRIAVAFDERVTGEMSPTLEDAARTLSMSLIPAPYAVDSPAPGLDRARAAGAQAVYFRSTAGAVWPSRQKPLHAWARRHQMTVIHAYPEAVETGGLMGYGPYLADLAKRAPYFIDRLLRGARPEDMPLEQPNVLRLFVNLEAARAIGVTIPQQVLLQADKVIG